LSAISGLLFRTAEKKDLDFLVIIKFVRDAQDPPS